MRPRLRTLLLSLSMLLCAGSAAAAVRNLSAGDQWVWTWRTRAAAAPHDHMLTVSVTDGYVQADYLALYWASPRPPGTFRDGSGRPCPPFRHVRLQSGARPARPAPPFRYWQYAAVEDRRIETSCSLWLVAGVAALPILAHVVLGWRARDAARLRQGLCLRCGYDLRASKNRCPECGTPAPPAVQSTAAPARPSTHHRDHTTATIASP